MSRVTGGLRCSVRARTRNNQNDKFKQKQKKTNKMALFAYISYLCRMNTSTVQRTGINLDQRKNVPVAIAAYKSKVFYPISHPNHGTSETRMTSTHVSPSLSWLLLVVVVLFLMFSLAEDARRSKAAQASSWLAHRENPPSSSVDDSTPAIDANASSSSIAAPNASAALSAALSAAARSDVFAQSNVCLCPGSEGRPQERRAF